MKKVVSIELEYDDIVSPHQDVFHGGVKDIAIGEDDLRFSAFRKQNSDDHPNERSSLRELSGSIQVNVYGTSVGFRELGRYFLALAEISTGEDPDFHEHIDNLTSSGGKSHFDMIFHRLP